MTSTLPCPYSFSAGSVSFPAPVLRKTPCTNTGLSHTVSVGTSMVSISFRPTTARSASFVHAKPDRLANPAIPATTTAVSIILIFSFIL